MINNGPKQPRNTTVGPQMKSYEEDEDGVTLHFDHGQPPVHAKLAVGADGYFSKVRTQCLNDGPPDFVVSSRAAT